MMGGPCFNGGGTIEEMFMLVDEMNRDRFDRYEELVYVRRVPLYRSCYEIIEKDSGKGIRITKVDAESRAIIRETK